MKNRKFAYVCTPHRGSKHYSRKAVLAYCMKLYKMGYIPVSPWLMFPFLDTSQQADMQEMKEFAKALIRRFNVFILTGPLVTAQMRDEYTLAKEKGKHMTTLDGMTMVQVYANQPICEDEC